MEVQFHQPRARARVYVSPYPRHKNFKINIVHKGPKTNLLDTHNNNNSKMKFSTAALFVILSTAEAVKRESIHQDERALRAKGKGSVAVDEVCLETCEAICAVPDCLPLDATAAPTKRKGKGGKGGKGSSEAPVSIVYVLRVVGVQVLLPGLFLCRIDLIVYSSFFQQSFFCSEAPSSAPSITLPVETILFSTTSPGAAGTFTSAFNIVDGSAVGFLTLTGNSNANLNGIYTFDGTQTVCSAVNPVTITGTASFVATGSGTDNAVQPVVVSFFDDGTLRFQVDPSNVIIAQQCNPMNAVGFDVGGSVTITP
jgi:hypothetical protein